MKDSIDRRSSRYFGVLIGAMVATSVFSGGTFAQAPVKLNIGIGPGGDFTLYLIKLKPEIARNHGKSYTLDLQLFSGSDMRLRAFLSGALEGATSSANAIAGAASKGVKFTVVASVTMGSSKGFSTSYMVREDSSMRTLQDLKGKLVGTNALRSSTDLAVRLAAEKAGLDRERDIRFAVVGFPEQGQALRSRQIDVGAFSQPFFALEKAKGGLRVLFTTYDVFPFEHDIQVLFFRPDVLQQSAAAVRDFLADFSAATKFYLEHTAEARQLLLKANIIRLPENIFLAMDDYYRDPQLRISIDGLNKIQEAQIRTGYQSEAADFNKLVDLSYLPR